MIPKVGDTVIAMIRQRVKVLSVDHDAATVELIPDTPLPDGARVLFRGVPFEYLTENVE